jgi:hypothetical protein
MISRSAPHSTACTSQTRSRGLASSFSRNLRSRTMATGARRGVMGAAAAALAALWVGAAGGAPAPYPGPLTDTPDCSWTAASDAAAAQQAAAPVWCAETVEGDAARAAAPFATGMGRPWTGRVQKKQDFCSCAQTKLDQRPSDAAKRHLRHSRAARAPCCRVQKTLTLPQHRRGCHIITGKIYDAVPEISEMEVRRGGARGGGERGARSTRTRGKWDVGARR